MRELHDHKVDGDLPQNQLRIRVLDDRGPGGAHHRYMVDCPGGEAPLGEVHFQKGAIAESGINGVTHEALLAILIDRLGCFQAGPFPSAHNGEALHHLRVALMHLQNRTRERIDRGVEGKTVA